MSHPILEALLNPFLICLLILIIICISTLDYSFKSAVFIATIVVLLIISTGFLPRFLCTTLENKYSYPKELNKLIKYVVVLGGGQDNNAILYCASIRRVLEGVKVYEQLGNATLILSGGGKASSSEAENMQKLIGVKKVILETRSLNTLEQFQNLVKIVKHEKFYLVTSAIHMPRAMYLANKFKLNALAVPVFSAGHKSKMWLPHAKNISYLNSAIHEYAGLVWYLGALKFSSQEYN